MFVIKDNSTYKPSAQASDLQLLKSISKSEGDKIESDVAFNEFFKRYRSFLLRVCRKACSSFDDSSLADDIFQNTFLKVLHKSHTFKLKDESKTNISIEIKAWLSRIARNELINFLRKNPDEQKLSDTHRKKSEEMYSLASDQIEEDEIPNQNDPKLIQKNILDQALDSLDSREKYILLAYMQFFDPTQPLKHLPADVLDNISQKFNINTDNIRQIKSRAFKKLKNKIEGLKSKNN